MKTIIITPVLGIALLVGCGPSAQQQLQKRVCEMYEDAGGSRTETSLNEWLEFFNAPERVAEIKANNARHWDNPYITPETVQSRAESQFAYGKEKNDKARGIVSLRLNLSMREVNEALAKCFPRVAEPVKKVAPPAPKVVVPAKEEVPDAADAERRTKELLQRTEGLVITSAPVRKSGIVFGTDFTVVDEGSGISGPRIAGERKVFSVGEKIAFVAEFGRSVPVTVSFTIVADNPRDNQWPIRIDRDMKGSDAYAIRFLSPAGDRPFPVGHYRMTARVGNEVLASGEFSVEDKK